MSINPLKFPDDSTRENISSSKQIEIVDVCKFLNIYLFFSN